jgi:hypothetical protein
MQYSKKVLIGYPYSTSITKRISIQHLSIPTNQVSIFLATQVILIYTKVGKGSRFKSTHYRRCSLMRQRTIIHKLNTKTSTHTN